ncbi:MAG: outer membrane beta-barrel protein, partial [Bacteroidota bacterium]
MRISLPIRFLSLCFFVLFACTCVRAQSGEVKGQLLDAEAQAVAFANVALYQEEKLMKVETTDDAGVFYLRAVEPGNYTLKATYLGAPDLTRQITVGIGTLDLEVLRMEPTAVELAEATVTATRALVEIKPDRTVFNVQGTINAVGENGLDLLRKAPGVTIDNNDNINVLSRSGVLVYVDGKRLPLGGADLANYLRNLTAEQIDRIDIITNPGAKYEAEGNAGILDIRLKKNENEGANGTVSTTMSQGRYNRYNLNANGNYRNRALNAFANVGYSNDNYWNRVSFNSFQGDFLIDKDINFYNTQQTPNYRFGTDFFLGKNHTLGFLVSGRYTDANDVSGEASKIFQIDGNRETPDSLLFAPSDARSDRGQNTFNLNYRFDPGKGKSLNVDLDYGRFRTDNFRNQPNAYLSPDGNTVLSEINNFFDTPTDIDIYTAKLDYEQPLAGGQFGAGVKFSQVGTKNTFLLYDLPSPNERVLNNRRSNQFDYDENVYAAYLSYGGRLNERISYTAGLRMEVTDAMGNLTPFAAELA